MLRGARVFKFNPRSAANVPFRTKFNGSRFSTSSSLGLTSSSSSNSSFFGNVARAFAFTSIVSAGGVAAFAYNFQQENGEEALPRLVHAYRYAIPAFIQYKSVDVFQERLPAYFGLKVDREEVEKAYEALHQLHAPVMYEKFLELRGFFLKNGQMIANNFGDSAPPFWQKTFEPILDHVPHKPFSHVQATIEGELGRPISEVFSKIEEEPIAAASIGQVHRATLRESGKNVVVKVMYEEVERQFRGDVKTARYFVSMAMPVHLPALTEIEKQFANEFDYRREALQLQQVGDNLRRTGSLFQDFVVPKPFMDLCTKRILVMEEVQNAESVTSALEKDISLFAAMNNESVSSFMKKEKALNEEAYAKGELRNGPNASTMDKFIASQRARSGMFGSIVRYFLPTPMSPPGSTPEKRDEMLRAPVNHARLLDRLFMVHGHEILVDGYFNGDPHPGNFLLSYGSDRERRLNSRDAKIALVDYGQVKELTKEQRLQLARLLVALARMDDANPSKEDRLHVAKCIGAMGFETKRKDPEVAFKAARVYFDRDDRVITGNRHIQQYIEDLDAEDATTKVVDDFVLVVRANVMLRGLGHMLNQHRRASIMWRGIAEKVMRDNGEDPNAKSFY
jgi:aarF domain-containing kinase